MLAHPSGEFLDMSLSLIQEFMVLNTEFYPLKDRSIIKDKWADKFTHSYILILIIFTIDRKLFFSIP